MIVKICGITNRRGRARRRSPPAPPPSASISIRHSPRYIAPELAAAHRHRRRPPRRRVRQRTARAHRRAIAAHRGARRRPTPRRRTPAEYPAASRVWKAARVDRQLRPSRLDDAPAEALLLDGPAAELYGGSGQTFDWTSPRGVRATASSSPAASTPTNVARAIALAQPWGVDACSRIESAPGIKDHAKMQRLLLSGQGGAPTHDPRNPTPAATSDPTADATSPKC